MRVLIVGGGGQLGRALAAAAPDGAEVVSYDRGQLDITDEQAVRASFEAFGPQWVFNAAAYTAVDEAENDEAAALAINATAVGVLSDAAERVGAQLVHVSTDFVFDGAVGRPYAPEAVPNPLGVYGRTKLAGERLAKEDALIVRTAWVYAPSGSNFVRTMLRLFRERPAVRVVADQVGTPTYAPGLATALWALAGRQASGIHHYTDSGVASWYDFAVAIQEEGLALGLLADAVPVIPIATEDFPTPARRPPYSVLDTRSTFTALAGPAPHWRVNLRTMLEQVKAHG